MIKKVILIFLFLVSTCKCESPIQSDTLFIAFWNVENLFDIIDDPQKDDQEFLPSGTKEWTKDRLDKKMYNLARVINDMNYGNGPDVIGICECENQSILESFVNKHFQSRNFKIIYSESPDERGIDCGLIYRSDKLGYVSSQSYEVVKLSSSATRLVLHAALQTKDGEKINFFVNHWPSRRNGASESEFKRIETAKVLKWEVDALYEKNVNANIIIMGDFNDEPVDQSVLKTLGAEPFKCDTDSKQNAKIPPKELYNISYNLFEQGYGTLSFRGDWNLFDQMIISSSLVTQKGLSYVCDSFSIFNTELVSTRSGKYKGAPFPTFGGNRYLGGYSDHFAVTAKFIVR